MIWTGRKGRSAISRTMPQVVDKSGIIYSRSRRLLLITVVIILFVADDYEKV